MNELRFRNHEVYKYGRLSVQASETHYCKPRKTGLPLSDYTLVEVGLLSHSGGLCRPSDLLGTLHRYLPFLPRARTAHALDRMFEDGDSPIAGYVSRTDLARLRDYLGGDILYMDDWHANR